MVTRCMTCKEQLVVFRAGTRISTYTAVDIEQVQEGYPESINSMSSIYRNQLYQGTVPGHLKPLIEAAQEVAKNPRSSDAD